MATDSNTVTVDLEKEVEAAAAKQGISREGLDSNRVCKLRDVFKQTLQQYYKGRDDGYAEGFRDGFGQGISVARRVAAAAIVILAAVAAIAVFRWR